MASLSTGAVTFNRVEVATGAMIGGNITYGDLILAYGKKYYFTTSSTHTFLDSLYARGHCLSPVRLECSMGTANFNKSSGSIAIEYAELKGIAAGGGAVFNAIATTDLGSNSGWQFLPAPARTLYWVGGQGEWGDTAHWSVSSGGTGGECPPTAVDDVVFDAASFINLKDTITLDAYHAHCHNMTWTSTVKAPVFLGDPLRILHVWGSIRLKAGMHWAMLGSVQFEATTPGHVVGTEGVAFLSAVEFKGSGGGWTLLDSLRISDGNLIHTRGHLNTAGNKVDCRGYVSTDPYLRELSLGASKFLLREKEYEAFQLNGTFFTLNAGTSEIILGGKGAIFLVENNATLEFYDLSFSNDSGSAELIKPGAQYNRLSFHSHARIKGDTEIDSLMLAPGKNYVFEAQTSQIIGTLVANGNCNHPILLETDSLGYAATFTMGPDTSKVFDLIIQDLVCTPDSMIVADNSIGLGKTAGWLIHERQGADYYWINGTGEWSDSSHWSTSSGGLPVNCLPSPVDNVIFDNNSFVGSTDTIDGGSGLLLCHDVRWINSTKIPLFTGNEEGSWRIHGSMLLGDSMDYNYPGKLFFKADTTGKTLTTRNHHLLNDVVFHHPHGGWTLLDSLILDCQGCALDHLQGYLVLRDRPVRVPAFRSLFGLFKTLDIRSSDIIIKDQSWIMNADSLILLADSSHIQFEGITSNMMNFHGDTVPYY
ncbi:MAG: hypothetical protein IH599_03200, partial [Bacteroidales bacterium]|nr:hypothetical protein [Bacteroidales bacterium]